MSAQELLNATTSSGASRLKHPPCPNCRRRMMVRQVTPALLTDDVDDMVYGCDECGTESRFTVKRK